MKSVLIRSILQLTVMRIQLQLGTHYMAHPFSYISMKLRRSLFMLCFFAVVLHEVYSYREAWHKSPVRCVAELAQRGAGGLTS